MNGLTICTLRIAQPSIVKCRNADVKIGHLILLDM